MLKKRGLKIHQTKSGCAKRISETHRIYKTEATCTQEQNHSGSSCRVDLTTLVVDEITEDQKPKGQEVRIRGAKKSDETKKEFKIRDKDSAKIPDIDIHIGEDLYMDITSWIGSKSEQEQETKKTAKVKAEKKDHKTQDIRKWVKSEDRNSIDPKSNTGGGEKKVPKVSIRIISKPSDVSKDTRLVEISQDPSIRENSAEIKDTRKAESSQDPTNKEEVADINDTRGVQKSQYIIFIDDSQDTRKVESSQDIIVLDDSQDRKVENSQDITVLDDSQDRRVIVEEKTFTKDGRKVVLKKEKALIVGASGQPDEVLVDNGTRVFN